MMNNSSLDLIERFPIPVLNTHRTIRVHLPCDYASSNKSYPVLYMHDGENLFPPGSRFSGHSWEAGSTLDCLQREGILEGMILVGIDSNPKIDTAVRA